MAELERARDFCRPRPQSNPEKWRREPPNLPSEALSYHPSLYNELLQSLANYEEFFNNNKGNHQKKTGKKRSG